ncbi:MAG: hypothetical protein KAR47_01150, partial [Planctomycetes bacterium]|nr:hypothetical protein [Planctomycetota bacterium]
MNVDYKQYDKDKPTLSKNMSYSGIQSNCVRKYLAKAHICFLVLYLLSAMPIFLGCDQREVALTTKRRVTWYNGGSQFVGISETMPTDVRDLDLDLKHCSFSVFWDIHGSLQEFSIKTPAMHAFFCKKLGKVIVPTLSDVLMISLDGTSTQRSLGEE